MAATAPPVATDANGDVVMEDGLPEGVTVPPEQIRNVINRLAEYIGRNGPAFEARVLDKNKGSRKYEFITNPQDPYRPYWLWKRSQELDKAKTGNPSAGKSHQPQLAQQQQQQQQPQNKPAEYDFCAKMPVINTQDLDVLRLTARFCAKNGRDWQHELLRREHTNPQLEFLRSSHSFHQYFNAMVEQYRKLMDLDGTNFPEFSLEKRKQRVKEIIANPRSVLDRAKERAAYDNQQTQDKREQQEAADREKREFGEVDWNDFDLVETIVFDEEDKSEQYEPPVSLESLQNASLEAKRDRSLATLVSGSRRIEEAMPDEDVNYNATAFNAPAAPAPMASPVPPPPGMGGQGYGAPGLSSPPPAMTGFNKPAPVENDRLAERNAQFEAQARARAAASAAPPINVRKDYQRGSRAAAARKPATSICPNCHQAIPVDEMTEHLRVEMVDPQYFIQKSKEQQRHSTTNLSTAEVAQNLKRLASQRTDVFDVNEGEVLTEEEKQRRKRAAVSYNGVIPGLAMHGPTGRGPATGGSDRSGGAVAGGGHSTNLQEQLRHIQQKAQQQ